MKKLHADSIGLPVIKGYQSLGSALRVALRYYEYNSVLWFGRIELYGSRFRQLWSDKKRP